MSERRAFVDESYVSRTGQYLLAAVVIDDGQGDDARDAALEIRRHRRNALHWHDERRSTRLAIISAVAARTAAQVVVVTTPVPENRQERGRAVCIAPLLAHLQASSPPVARVILESRTGVLDRRDAQRIEGLRASHRLTDLVRYEFATKSEPLLWLADAVAGAVGSALAGDDTYAELLGDRLTLIRLPSGM